jgi:hypothetical protein
LFPYRRHGLWRNPLCGLHPQYTKEIVKMKTNKRFITAGVLALALILGLTAAAFAQTEADFIVELTDDGAGVVIKKYTGKTAAVTIPATIQGMPVREIGGGAFLQSGITSVIIPRGVTLIGGWAFRNCGKLAQVTLPAGLTFIGDEAFAYCGALRTIVLPDSVTGLGRSRAGGGRGGVFAGSGLTSITLSRNLKIIQDATFVGCERLTSVVIPEGVTSIGMAAFSGCSALPSVTLPPTIKVIDMYAFARCSALSSITIPDSVSSISFYERSFEGCSKLPLATQAALKKRGYRDGF